MSKGKPARQWAAEIADLPNLEARRARLREVPRNLLPLVETHLKLLWGRRHRHGRS